MFDGVILDEIMLNVSLPSVIRDDEKEGLADEIAAGKWFEPNPVKAVYYGLNPTTYKDDLLREWSAIVRREGDNIHRTLYRADYGDPKGGDETAEALPGPSATSDEVKEYANDVLMAWDRALVQATHMHEEGRLEKYGLPSELISFYTEGDRPAIRREVGLR